VIGLDALELTGRSRTHVVEIGAPRCILHRDAAGPFLALHVAAWAEAGIDLVPVSAFRDFERQRLIWNAKWRGQRPMLDRAGRALDGSALAPAERVEAILWWSALPGASRHHWGTDVDVIDAAALPPGYAPKLSTDEYAEGGIFRRLDRWLEARAGRFGFYRPYRTARDGVQPEAWHLSYAPIATLALHTLTPAVIADALRGAEVEGREAILAQLPELYARYVDSVDPP
jgi:LAS superfamily LD-carboxypeptidase LdcB